MISLKAIKRTDKEMDSVMIPGVLYGPGIENQSIAVDLKEFQAVYKEVGETLITLVLGSASYSALVREVQFDNITGDPIHVDFYQPNLKNTVETHVPVELVGIAPGVSKGGTIVINLHELPVKALPQDLPVKIEVDISVLDDIGSNILVKDVKVGKGVEILGHSEEILVHVAEPTDVDAELQAEEEVVAEVPEN